MTLVPNLRYYHAIRFILLLSNMDCGCVNSSFSFLFLFFSFILLLSTLVYSHRTMAPIISGYEGLFINLQTFRRYPQIIYLSDSLNLKHTTWSCYEFTKHCKSIHGQKALKNISKYARHIYYTGSVFCIPLGIIPTQPKIPPKPKDPRPIV